MIEAGLTGEIPRGSDDGVAEEPPVTEAVDFKTEIKVDIIGVLELPARNSSARAV
jgi:hypothetical protein